VCINIFVGLCRHYQMEGTKVAYIGLWLTSIKREGPWHSFYVPKMIRWWDPLKILLAGMGPNTILILHGQICLNLLKIITEQMNPHSQISPTGCYFPNHKFNLMLINKVVSVICYFIFIRVWDTIFPLNSPCCFPTFQINLPTFYATKSHCYSICIAIFNIYLSIVLIRCIFILWWKSYVFVWLFF
jgi:hypothetical protein